MDPAASHLGASADGYVSCMCSGSGVLEINAHSVFEMHLKLVHLFLKELLRIASNCQENTTIIIKFKVR